MEEITYPYREVNPDVTIEYFEFATGEGAEQQKWALSVFVTQSQTRSVGMGASEDWNLKAPEYQHLCFDGYKELQRLTDEYKQYFEQANNADEIRELAEAKNMIIVTEYIGPWIIERYKTDDGIFAKQIIPTKIKDLPNR